MTDTQAKAPAMSDVLALVIDWLRECDIALTPRAAESVLVLTQEFRQLSPGDGMRILGRVPKLMARLVRQMATG